MEKLFAIGLGKEQRNGAAIECFICAAQQTDTAATTTVAAAFHHLGTCQRRDLGKFRRDQLCRRQESLKSDA